MEINCKRNILLEICKLMLALMILSCLLALVLCRDINLFFNIEINKYVVICVAILIFAITFAISVHNLISNAHKITTIELESDGINLVDFKNNKTHYSLDKIQYKYYAEKNNRYYELYYGDEKIINVVGDIDNLKKYLDGNNIKGTKAINLCFKGIKNVSKIYILMACSICLLYGIYDYDIETLFLFIIAFILIWYGTKERKQVYFDDNKIVIYKRGRHRNSMCLKTIEMSYDDIESYEIKKDSNIEKIVIFYKDILIEKFEISEKYDYYDEFKKILIEKIPSGNSYQLYFDNKRFKYQDSEYEYKDVCYYSIMNPRDEELWLWTADKKVVRISHKADQYEMFKKLIIATVQPNNQ